MCPPDLSGIKAPVLLIHGRYDRMVPFEVGIAILSHIADRHLVLLNNCGHWPPFEEPAEWAAQVLAFLAAAEWVASQGAASSLLSASTRVRSRRRLRR